MEPIIATRDRNTGILPARLADILSASPPDRSGVQYAAFSPDGRCLALDLNDGTVVVYELATMQPRAVRTFTSVFRSLSRARA